MLRLSKILNVSRSLCGVACFVLTACQSATAQSIQVESISTLPQADGDYRAWPTMTRLDDGRLVVVYSGNRSGHIGPYGRVEMMVSEDEGETWGDSIEVLDTQTDDRDGGVVQTAAGSVLVSTFTSNAWISHLAKVESEWDQSGGKHTSWHTEPIDQERLDQWRRMRDAVPQRLRGNTQGWVMRYEDIDKPWTQLIAAPVHTPNGPIALGDGSLLMLGETSGGMQAHISRDDGLTWSHAGTVPLRDGDAPNNYFEADAAQLDSGRIIAHIRNHNDRSKFEILQSVSDDNGQTWSPPETTGIWGYPADLLSLGGERLLTSYGKRKRPISIATRISEDGGRTWSEEMVIATDLPHMDMGYPTTVRLSNDRFATLWYQVSADDRYESTLGFATWTLAE